MTDLAQGQAARQGCAISRPPAPRPSVPSPASIRPRRQPAAADSGRATARAVLDDALSGVDLTAADRRFLARLSQWDKRNATIVASLLARARQVGRQEAGADLAAAMLSGMAARPALSRLDQVPDCQRQAAVAS